MGPKKPLSVQVRGRGPGALGSRESCVSHGDLSGTLPLPLGTAVGRPGAGLRVGQMAAQESQPTSPLGVLEAALGTGLTASGDVAAAEASEGAYYLERILHSRVARPVGPGCRGGAR